MLNVTCIKIHSIILSVTCHGLRNFPLPIQDLLISIRKFLKPCELLFFELGSLIKCELYKNSLNNFICHLSWLEKLSLTHTHTSKPFMNFQNPTSGVIQRWNGVGYAVKQPKNDSPQNQDLTTPKSFLEGVQNPSFEYKNNLYYHFFYYNCVIFPIISKNYYQMLLV